MARFNGRTATDLARTERREETGSSPLAVVDGGATTHEGGIGFSRAPRADLYLMTVAGLVAEDSFYEKAGEKMARLRMLVENITAADNSVNAEESGAWFVAFIHWMRESANIRTGAIITAAEAVKARLAADKHGHNREIVRAALSRADEPGEFVAYWLAQWGGQTLPKPVKRGLSDAVVDIYDEFSVLRYDTGSHGVRFGDVVSLAQPRTNARPGTQNDALLRHLIDRRHTYNTSAIPEALTMLRTRAELEAVPAAERRALVELAAKDMGGPVAARLRAAGLTWEWLGRWIDGPLDATAWKVALPTIGYMAALRNLRNLDEAGLDDDTAAILADRLADPEQVRRSRQFPFRFLSAYEAVTSDRWRQPLGLALDAATANVPELEGSLVCVDTSGSMASPWSPQGSMNPLRTGALFGVTLARRSPSSTLIGFASESFVHKVPAGASVMSEVARFFGRSGEVGHGTNMVEAVRKHFRPGVHKRVIMISDEQAFGSPYGTAADQVPRDVPFYSFNLGGYAPSVTGLGANRHQLGGLTDHTFRSIPLIEQGIANGWPWEQ